MAEKDIVEKYFEDYNDVFSDIVNVVLFHGATRVKAEDLLDCTRRSIYKSDRAQLHEMERDISKYWKYGGEIIALCGIENQTEVDRRMPMRIFGYEGASYRSQYNDKGHFPVVTIVVYFGIEHRWKEPICLQEIVNIPQGLEPFVNNIHINVCEVAWLPDEVIEQFKSDFRIVARFFSEKRKNKYYIPNDPQEIQHVDALLKFLSVMTGDTRYEELLATPGEVKNMCEVAERLINKGLEKGREEGIEKGLNVLARIIDGASDEELISEGESIETITKMRKILAQHK